MTSCGNEPLFKDGKGCGSCYQVGALVETEIINEKSHCFDYLCLLLAFFQIRCVNHPACSGIPETVIITDMNYYPVAKYHFDLSGTAFGAMAKSGRSDELRHAGIIDMQFKRYHCG
jgi:hypothetical protein